MKSTVWLVQLPFPSQSDPNPLVHDYYRAYGAKFRREFPEFFVPEHDLWELPLWVAHLAGMLGEAGFDYDFLDLSLLPAIGRGMQGADYLADRVGHDAHALPTGAKLRAGPQTVTPTTDRRASSLHGWKHGSAGAERRRHARPHRARITPAAAAHTWRRIAFPHRRACD